MSIDNVKVNVLEENLASDAIDNIQKELQRIEECCDYSSKGHFVSSKDWEKWHFWLGISATIFSIIASCLASACLGYGHWVVIMTMLASAASAIITFLKPSEQSEIRRSFANQYLAHRNQCRRFREIEITLLRDNSQRLLERFSDLAQKFDDLNNSAPTIPDYCYKKAKRGIEAGQTIHKVDLQEKQTCQ